MAVDVIVNVAVAVSAPVIVAALVNRNDTVGVIDAVSEAATSGWERPKLVHAPLSESSTYTSARS
jgi:hypothetical protein